MSVNRRRARESRSLFNLTGAYISGRNQRARLRSGPACPTALHCLLRACPCAQAAAAGADLVARRASRRRRDRRRERASADRGWPEQRPHGAHRRDRARAAHGPDAVRLHRLREQGRRVSGNLRGHHAGAATWAPRRIAERHAEAVPLWMARAGVVTTCGAHGLCDGNGRHYFGGASVFWAPWAFSHDQPRLMQALDQLVPGAFDYVRIIAHVTQPAASGAPARTT
jgi:hypothetical protein